MANPKVRTYHGKQGQIQPTVIGSDKIVIAQPDTSAAEGFRTVNINADQAYIAIRDVLKTTPNLVAVGTGLLGTGTPDNPIRIDEEYLSRKWVNRRFTNFAQVGNRPGTTLGSRSGTMYTFNAQACFLAGITQTVAAQTFDLAWVMGDNQNKIIYLYLVAVNRQLQLEWSYDKRADRYDLAYLAKFRLDSNRNVVEEDGFQFIRFGSYRLSQESGTQATQVRGGAIPVSAGIVYSIAYTVSGSIAGDTILMNKTINGRGIVQNMWPGKSTDRILISGAEATVSHAFSGMFVPGEDIWLAPSFVIKTDNNNAKPLFLILRATDTGGFERNINLRQDSQAGFEVRYNGVTVDDNNFLNECIARGITSNTLTVQITGAQSL